MSRMNNTAKFTPSTPQSSRNQKKKRADACISRLGLVLVILPKLEEVAKEAVVPLSLTVSEVLGRPKFV
jgi:hypothetical protein